MSDQIPGMPATSELLAGLAVRGHDGKTPDHYAGSGVTAGCVHYEKANGVDNEPNPKEN